MRRRIAPEDKARLVLRFISSKQPIATLRRTHRISSGNYYRWRKTFVRGGTEALKRAPKHTRLTVARGHPQIRQNVSRDAETLRLMEQFAALKAEGIHSRAGLPAAARASIVNLINLASIPKVVAIRLAGLPRSTYYDWRKPIQTGRSPWGQRSKPEHVRLTDRDYVKEAVFKILHSPPTDHGCNRTTWKVDDLQQALEKSGLTLGKHAIRTVIKVAGYRWLKARKVLTSKDPDYRTKLDNIHRILGNLSEDEGFFSIDEYGPFAIKCRQGRRLVAPGQTAIVPQWRKSKGILIMTAALELSTNQVTHFYSKKKNTDEMALLAYGVAASYIFPVLSGEGRHEGRRVPDAGWSAGCAV